MQKCHSQKDKARLHLIGVGGGPSYLAVFRWLAKVPLGVVAPCLVKTTLVVGLLGKGAGLFLRRPACQPCSTLVPTGLLKDKPDVPSPENEVEKPKSLKRKRKRRRTLTLTFLISKHFNSCSSSINFNFLWKLNCFQELNINRHLNCFYLLLFKYTFTILGETLTETFLFRT